MFVFWRPSEYLGDGRRALLHLVDDWASGSPGQLSLEQPSHSTLRHALSSHDPSNIGPTFPLLPHTFSPLHPHVPANYTPPSILQSRNDVPKFKKPHWKTRAASLVPSASARIKSGVLAGHLSVPCVRFALLLFNTYELTTILVDPKVS